MRLHRLALAAVAMLFPPVIDRGLTAAEPAADSSLKLVPADAAFYSTSLRLGEQLDRFLNSNAYARLKALPAAKLAVEHLRQQAGDSDNPLGHVMQLLKDPANQELAGLLRDMFRQEIFIYGGAGWTDLFPVLQAVNYAQWTGPLQALMSGQAGNASKAQARAMLQALNDHADKLAFPDLTIGFKLSNTQAATDQIKRLEDVLNRVTANTPLKGRVKRAQVAGTDALTLTVDGSLVPIDQIPWSDIEDHEGQYQKLRGRLKAMTLSVALLIKNDYLLLTVGPNINVGEKLGRGESLSSRPELAPLGKFADRKLLSIGYSSKSMATAVAPKAEDITGFIDLVKGGLDNLPIPEKRRSAIDKDLKRLAETIVKELPKPGAELSFSFLSAGGQEGYAYDYSVYPDAVEPKPLMILEHLGGSPLVALAGRLNDPTTGYRDLVKGLKILFGHVEAAGKDLADQFGQEDAYKKFQEGVETVRPFLKRFDETTGNQLLPALGAGELALVIDAKWTSKNWFEGFDQHGKALPLPELGIVRTANDGAKVTEALRAYRLLFDDVLAKARELGAPIPGEGIPKPQAQRVDAGTLYYWPLDVPGASLDKQIQPNFGIADKLVAFSLSLKHTERLLTPTTLHVEQVPAEIKGPATFAAIVDFAGFVNMVRPWVEQLALPMLLEQMPEEKAPPGLGKKDIPPQVKTVLDVLGCLRTYTAVKYRQGDATVTHSELVIRDLP
ncbi:MAG TPA: hypothetical protein VH120_19825 [Gemmataceae bacterium]|nr:hypothetical protein [Gemmataceae bacterium]